uniref:Phlebovirus glycoprotein G2 fusion domain-containing protein n=1 Tax=Trichuris muris TaxID=70415 RepID=A0A5S6QBI7_TRIMR
MSCSISTCHCKADVCNLSTFGSNDRSWVIVVSTKVEEHLVVSTKVEEHLPRWKNISHRCLDQGGRTSPKGQNWLAEPQQQGT